MEAIQTADVSHTVPNACGDFSLADETPVGLHR